MATEAAAASGYLVFQVDVHPGLEDALDGSEVTPDYSFVKVQSLNKR